jgi:hypothetical protein
MKEMTCGTRRILSDLLSQVKDMPPHLDDGITTAE